MRADQIESWSFGRSDAAEIVGIEEATLANWLNRYNPFPHKRQGRGSPMYFDLSDLMLIAGIKALVDHGFKPEQAADVMEIYGGIYGSMLHNDARASLYPGVMSLSKNNEGRWVAAEGPEKTVSVQVRAWPIFDEILPRFEKAILNNHGIASRENIQKAIDEYKAQIENIRKQRWA